MARIPGEAIERLKQEVSLQRLVEAQGIELKPARRGPAGAYPANGEYTLPLSLPPKNGMPFGLPRLSGPGHHVSMFRRSSRRLDATTLFDAQDAKGCYYMEFKQPESTEYSRSVLVAG